MWGQILTAADVGWCGGVQERVWRWWELGIIKLHANCCWGRNLCRQESTARSLQHRQHYLQGDRKLGIIIRWESCQLLSYLITTNTQSYIPSRQITDVRAPASPTRKSTAFFRCENKAQNMSKNQIPVTFSVLVLFVFQKLFCLALKSLPLFE